MAGAGRAQRRRRFLKAVLGRWENKGKKGVRAAE
jgi:hypothetical protein